MPPRKSHVQEIRARPPLHHHHKTATPREGVVNHVCDGLTGAVSGRGEVHRLPRPLQYGVKSIRPSMSAAAGLGGKWVGRDRKNRPSWFFRFLLLDLIGRLCFNEETVTAARTSYVTTAILWLTCLARHTVVRWKLYSSYYYYMFYFRFSFPISNTYHARTHIYYYINSMQHTHTHLCV